MVLFFFLTVIDDIVVSSFHFHLFVSLTFSNNLPGRVIPKTLKMVLDTSLLNTQQYKVGIKGKEEQSRENSSALHYAIEKGAFWSPTLLTYHLNNSIVFSGIVKAQISKTNKYFFCHFLMSYE